MAPTTAAPPIAELSALTTPSPGRQTRSAIPQRATSPWAGPGRRRRSPRSLPADNLEACTSAAQPRGEVLTIPDESLFTGDPAPAIDLDATDPCLITFTSGTTGEAKGIVHGQRYLPGQRLQAESWLDARPGDLVWCTAASGWSKSARNVFIAPWLRGAAALLHDARFDPAERLEILAREAVAVLCMAPTEYRVIAKRTTIRPPPRPRTPVAAREAPTPPGIRAVHRVTGGEV